MDDYSEETLEKYHDRWQNLSRDERVRLRKEYRAHRCMPAEIMMLEEHKI